MNVAENKCSPQLELDCVQIAVEHIRTLRHLDNIISMQY